MRRLLALLSLSLLLGLSSQVDAYKFAAGVYTGNDTDDRDIDISDTSPYEDFQPEFVGVKCSQALTNGYFSTPNFAAGTATAWDNTNAPAADFIQAFNANGFQVGASDGANSNPDNCHYVALASDANNDFAVGTYTGDGVTDGRDIDISDTSDSEDFEPTLVIVRRLSGGNEPQWRTTNLVGDATMRWDDISVGTDRIQALNPNGFEVGLNNAVNGSGIAYAYIALKGDQTASGSFTGDAGTAKQITSLSFEPTWGWTKGRSVTSVGCMKFQDQTTDLSYLLNAVEAADRIQDFLSNGFEVGTQACANESGITIEWFMMKEGVYASAAKKIRRVSMH